MYFFLKLMHIAAAIVFLGNITLGIFWKHAGDCSHDPRIIAHTLRSIIAADRLFTIPSVAVLALAGVATAAAGHIPILGTGWILWAIILFIVSGLAFGPTARYQRRLAALASAAAQAEGSIDKQAYAQLSAAWNLWGTIALVAPVMALILMVLKPALPAFHR